MNRVECSAPWADEGVRPYVFYARFAEALDAEQVGGGLHLTLLGFHAKRLMAVICASNKKKRKLANLAVSVIKPLCQCFLLGPSSEGVV